MKAEASKVMVAENSAKATEQTTENLSTDDMVKLGKDLYVQKGCTACHGVSGEGNVVGPNLTDKYWIHGNLNGDIFKSIKFGYATKGMTPYKDQLTDDKIQALVAYIEKDLVDSNPNNPKEPQGELVK
jgi:cytochrome c oxidase cbb3-type subunit 3